VRIERFDHPPGIHVRPAEERSDSFSVNFVEAGSFTVSNERSEWRVNDASIFVTSPGCWYRYDHADEVPCDVCLRIVFDERWRNDLVETAPAALAGRGPLVPITNRRAYLRERLLHHLDAGSPSLSIESICGEALFGATEEAGVARRLYRSSQLAWYASRIDRARERLDDEYASDHSLGSLSRSVGMSVFHFARLFRELTGIAPHQYLLRRRLAAARARLRAGSSVTDACFDSGFASLSHFIRMFKRAYGAPPSAERSARPRTS